MFGNNEFYDRLSIVMFLFGALTKKRNALISKNRDIYLTSSWELSLSSEVPALKTSTTVIDI